MCFSNFPFRNTLCVSMGKPFRNHKTCLEMGFSGGNTTQCQQCTANVFQYIDHIDEVGCLSYPIEHGFVHADLSLSDTIPHLSKNMIQKIACIHNISLNSWWHLPKEQLIEAFIGHNCINCNLYTSILKVHISRSLKKKKNQ